MERYKDYKVPVVALRSLSMMKKLKLQGVAVGVYADTPEVAELLKNELPGDEVALDVRLSAEEKVAIRATEGGDALLVDIKNGKESTASDDIEAEPELGLEEAALASEIEAEPLVKKRKTRSRKDTEEDTTAVISKFVNLTDLLPPLPQKGNFDVKTIKQSQYFFS